MARRQLAGRRVLITGAASGVGQALARELGRRGARLLLNARREPLLQSLCQELTAGGVEADYLAGDITADATRQSLRDAVTERWGALDVLVNNAAVGAVGPFADARPERLTEIFDVNFFAPVALIRATLPLLAQGSRPVIVNVGSVLGRVAAPLKSEYCASKFALLGFSNALRMELLPQRVDVLVVTPSTIASDFVLHHLEETTGAASGQIKRRLAMAPEYVARKIVRGLETGRRELFLPPISGWLLPILQACPALADWLALKWAPAQGRKP